jgi:cytidine deaminase
MSIMPVEPLAAADHELIAAATDVIERQYKPGKMRTARTVGGALRTESGKVYTGVNLTADTPRSSICAEPVAIGQAVADGHTEFDAVVAVLYDPGSEDEYDGDPDNTPEIRIIAPCGVCRELIRDYDPQTSVVLHGSPHDSEEPVKRPITDLLPDLSWRGGTRPE